MGQNNLSITFKGLNSTTGTIMLKISNPDGEAVDKKILKVNSQSPQYTFSLKAGQYAISAFHDENNNQKLDRNSFGMPKEKYGFSNNVRGTFGPPPIKDQLIDLQSEKAITILLK
jgi:uncharacterized protein (DUF2141 family)